MLTVRIQKKADSDLKSIWHYTYNNWGEIQARSYLLALNESFSLIAENPKIGVDWGLVRQGYRKLPFKKHMIVYRVTRKHISVVRVLGISMDYENHI